MELIDLVMKLPAKYYEQNGPDYRTKPCRFLVHNPDLNLKHKIPSEKTNETQLAEKSQVKNIPQ